MAEDANDAMPAAGDLVNRLTQELAQLQRTLAAAQQKLLGANRSLLARTQDLGEARAAVSLLLATLDASNQGVLAVAQFGRAMHYNTRFLEMWRITPERMESLNDAALLALQLSQVREPQRLLALVQAQKSRPGEVHAARLEITDGRVLECRIVPHRERGRRMGTVTCWRELPQAMNPSQTSFRPVSSIPA